MMRSTRQQRPALLAAALAAALALPAAAAAATEDDLEARIAELERQLAELKTAIATKAEAKPAPAQGAPAPIQATTVTPGSSPRSLFTVGGFMRTDALMTRTNGGEIPDGATARDLYIPGAIPVGGQREGTDLDTHIKFSRIWFGFDDTTEAGDKLAARLELDLFGGALGNEIATNTFGVIVRHVWFGWNNWLIGQTWSNFMDPAALPDSVDLIGPTDGTVFVREPMVKYTSGPWSVALENPQTTVTPFRGGTRIASDDGNLPDLNVRYRYTQPWGHLTAGAMLRQLKYQNRGANRIDGRTAALAGTVSGRYAFDSNNDIRFALNFGEGLGRYVGLGIVTDAVIDADGDLEAISGVAGFVAFRHVFNPKVRANVYWAGSRWDNDIALTGLGVTKRVESISANLFYTPVPRLDFGLEYRHGRRTLESGADGELDRLHFIARYAF
jgi:opacity protein-like surface antigen